VYPRLKELYPDSTISGTHQIGEATVAAG
jgi:hypothetical protein